MVDALCIKRCATDEIQSTGQKEKKRTREKIPATMQVPIECNFQTEAGNSQGPGTIPCSELDISNVDEVAGYAYLRSSI